MVANKPYRAGSVMALVLMSLLAACGTAPRIDGSTTPSSFDAPEVDLLITNARVYPAPGQSALENQTLLINNRRIIGIQPAAAADAKQSAKRVIDASGKTVTAGLWNSHVHFTAPELATQPQAVVDNMLLRFGFTHVVDTGSTLAQTIALKKAIASGQLRGPNIVLANGSFVYTNGTPSYLPGLKLPEVSSVAAAAPMVEDELAAGADGIKIFAGSFMTPTHTIHLPVEIIAAITKAAHAQKRFVMAHPTTIKGLTNAVLGGVDVLAHTTAPEVDIPGQVLQQMRQQNSALIPTLALWRYEMEKFGATSEQADIMEEAAVSQLRSLLAADIEILFGTDVGYKTDFDTAAEFRLMAKAGMDWPAIHRSLTTAPAQRFAKYTADRASTAAKQRTTVQTTTGELTTGAPAHLVLFNGDPADNIGVLADVALTIIDGRVVYAAQSASAANAIQAPDTSKWSRNWARDSDKP